MIKSNPKKRKSNPISARWVIWQIKWITIIPKKSSYCCEGSKPCVRLPSLGIQQKGWESPGTLTLKTSRI